MTSSGLNTFGVSTEQIDIITEMWERCGRTADSLSANDIDSARRSLNYLFSDWSNNEINLWKIELKTLALTTDTQSYTLDGNVIYIVQAATRTTDDDGVNTDLVISPISRAEYLALPNKAQDADRPTQYYLERTITPTLKVWPVADSNDVTLLYYAMETIEDAGTFLQTPDAPQRWMDAIAAGGAARLARKWAPDRVDGLVAEAAAAFDRAYSADRERVPMRIAPRASW